MMASKRLGAYKVPFKEVTAENQPTSNSQTVICETSINHNIESDKIKSLVQKRTSLKRKKIKTRGSPEMQNNVKVGKISENTGTETEIKTCAKIFEPKQQIENDECHVTKQDIWDTLQALLHEVVKQVCEDKLIEPFQNKILTDFKMKAPSSFSVLSKYDTSTCHPIEIETSNVKQETGCFDSEIQTTKGTGNLQCTFKTLSIFSMNALDLEKENQLREEYSFNDISKKETLKKNGGNESAQNKTLNMLQDDTEDSFYENFVPITKLCTEHGSKNNIGTSLDPDIHANMFNSFSNAPSKMHLFTEKEILKSDDKVEKTDTKSAKRSSDEEVGSRENKKKKNKENTPPSETKHSLGIFDQEDLITENIILRERGENEEDIIPTGIFQPLNEIFQYNQKDELFEPKLETQDIRGNKNITTEKLEGKTSNSNPSYLTGPNSIHELMDNSVKMNTQDNKESNIAVDDKQEPHKGKEEYQRKLENIHSKGDITNKNTRYNELSKDEGNVVEENNQSDIASFMEMDDDFNLTASQLSMLEADEKLEIENYSNGKCSTGQQTDIGGNQLINEQEILNQLSYLRCCIEYIKERIDK